MRINEILSEAKESIRDQIIAAVKRDGGSVDDYYIRFTDIDKLGYSAKQSFGKTPDVNDPKFSVDSIGAIHGRRALWFYPVKYFLNSKELFRTEFPYVFIVKLKPNAWLQTVKRGDKKVIDAPEGKERVGILRMSSPPAAIFFRPGYQLVSKLVNYKSLHRDHGLVKGPEAAPKPTALQRIRDKFGVHENKSLQELGTTQYKISEPKDMVNYDKNKQVTYKVFKFKVDKQIFMIVFTVKDGTVPGNKKKVPTLNVAFGRQDPEGWSDDDIDTNLTGDNQNQFQIYSTVVKAIHKFINQLNPNVGQIIIKGDNERQQIMYDRFFNSRYFEKYFPGWHINPTTKSLVRSGVSEGLRNVTIHSEFTEVFNTQPSKSATWTRPIGQWEDMDEFNFVASNGIAYQVDFLAPEVGPDQLDPYTFFKPDEEISDQAYESAKFVEFEQKSKPGDVGKQGIEGTGAAAEVFGIVTNVILQYIKKAKPSMLYFQAAETSRQRLYARMATRISQTIGWKVKQDGLAHFAIYNPRKIKANVPNQEVAEDEGQPTFHVSSHDDFETAFEVEMVIDNNNPGFFSYQYFPETDDVENDVYIHSDQYRGQGFGKLLLLKAIETAQQHGLPFKPDRNGISPEQRRVYQSLLNDRLINIGPDRTITLRGKPAVAKKHSASHSISIHEKQDVSENFADGKVKGKSRPGRVKSAGASCDGSVTDLRAKAKKYGGERGKMYHWCANMKSGRDK